MTSAPLVSSSTRKAVLVCSAAMISLAIAMGVGRFAFTPMFPLMLRDGLLNNANGTLLATSNYLGYLLGAMLAGRIKAKPSLLLVFGLVSTVAVTGGVGWASSVFVWALLRLRSAIYFPCEKLGPAVVLQNTPDDHPKVAATASIGGVALEVWWIYVDVFQDAF